MRVASDIGGTCTDLIYLDESTVKKVAQYFRNVKRSGVLGFVGAGILQQLKSGFI